VRRRAEGLGYRAAVERRAAGRFKAAAGLRRRKVRPSPIVAGRRPSEPLLI